MQLKFTAGKWEVEAWTEGYPMWVKIVHAGKEVEHGVHHTELRDLAYVIDRMTNAIRAALPTNDKHELD